MEVSIAEFNVVVNGLKTQNDLLYRQNCEWRDQNRQLRHDLAVASAGLVDWERKLKETAESLAQIADKHRRQRDACGLVARGEVDIGQFSITDPAFSSQLCDVERLRESYVDLLNKTAKRKK